MSGTNIVWKGDVEIDVVKKDSLTMMEYQANKQIDLLKRQAELLMKQEKEIQDRVIAITHFLTNNESHPWHDAISEYKTALEAIDSSSITYPYKKTIEQYCEENSITYYHPLQIP